MMMVESSKSAAPRQIARGCGICRSGSTIYHLTASLMLALVVLRSNPSHHLAGLALVEVCPCYDTKSPILVSRLGILSSTVHDSRASGAGTRESARAQC